MIQEVAEQFTEAVDLEWETPSKAGIFVLALITFDTAPTTSENITITFISKNGTAYDCRLHSIDPSLNSLTSVVYSPSAAIPMNTGDRIQVQYPNTDSRTVSVTLKGLDSSSF